MHQDTMRAFVDELAKIAATQEKDSGFLDAVKNIALHDVGGPKGILQPAGQAVAHAATQAVKKPGADFAKWTAQQAAKRAA